MELKFEVRAKIARAKGFSENQTAPSQSRLCMRSNRAATVRERCLARG